MGEFKEDMFHGYGVMIYSNGNVKQGIWKDDELVEKL